MNSVACWITSFLINAAWQITLIAAAGWLAARPLKRIGPHAEHVAWVSTLMAALLTPLFSYLIRVFAWPFLKDPTALQSSIIFDATGSGGASFSLRAPWALTELAVRLCITLYLGSLLYFAARFFRSWLFTAGLVREANRASLTPEQKEQWVNCQRRFSLKEAQILSSEKIPGPVALGLRRPVLLLPAEFAAQCEPQDLFAALAHECAHMQRKDFKKNLFYEIASLMVAFHPAVWFIKSQIAQTREMVCDAMATEMLGEPRSYAHSLLRLAALVAAAPRIATTPAVGIFDANILEKRIMRMKIKKQNIGIAQKAGLIVPAVFLLLSAGVAGAAMAVGVEQQPSPAAASQTSAYGPLYKIGKDVSAPAVLRSVNAEFPKSARGIKGPFDEIVVVSLIVDAAGMPHDVRVARSYNPDFDAQAIKAIKQYRFIPAKRAGKPVAVGLSIEVRFKRY